MAEDVTENPQPHNFIDAFINSAGQTEVPKKFLYWSAMACLAGAMQRNVFFRRAPWEKLFPNLYVFLLGPGALGKGTAINMANLFAEASRVHEGSGIHTFRGRLNFASLYDEMAAPEGEPSRALFLVSGELSDTVGKGEMAKRMVQTMTNLYEGHAYTPVSERTRAHGRFTLEEPCITWLAGSTESGFLECIDTEDFENGFIGRVCTVPVEEYPDVRVAMPDGEAFHAHYDWIIKKLARVAMQFVGELVLSQDARELYDTWYRTRPRTDYHSIEPSWRRLPATALKLCMIHHMAALGDQVDPGGSEWRTMPKLMMQRGIRDAESLLPGIIRFTERTLGRASHPDMYRVAEYIYQRHGCLERELSARFPRRVLRDVMDDLIRYGIVRRLARRAKDGHQLLIIEWAPLVPPGKTWESVLFARMERAKEQEG